MPLITVQFDRIFDVSQGLRARKEATVFGFESGTIKQDGIVVPGRPGLNEGDTVTAYLSYTGNWQSLVGWINHTTGELVLKRIESNEHPILRDVVVMSFTSLFPPLISTIAVVWLLFRIFRATNNLIDTRRARFQLETFTYVGKNGQ